MPNTAPKTNHLPNPLSPPPVPLDVPPNLMATLPSRSSRVGVTMLLGGLRCRHRALGVMGGWHGWWERQSPGLTFDHTLSCRGSCRRVERWACSCIISLVRWMIHDTLGGSLVCFYLFYWFIDGLMTILIQPSNLPAFPSALPPIRPPPHNPDPPKKTKSAW